MAQVPMFDAIPGGIASSAHNNAMIDNIQDHETRVVVVENRTTNTSGTVGIGNQRLSDRIGAGITTAAPADTRLATVESTTTNITTGNSALGTRVTALEAASGTSPIVRAIRANGSATQSVTAGGLTAVIFTSAPRNPNTMWSAGNPSRITIPSGQTGLYQITGLIVWEVNATGTRSAIIRTNGSSATDVRCGAPWAGNASVYTETPVSTYLELNAGDYIEMLGFSFGATLNMTTTGTAGFQFIVVRRMA